MRHKLVNNRYRWTPDNNEPDDGTITNTKMADNAIGNAELADSAVNTAELADNAVTTAKITDANVSTAKLADDAVTNAKVATDAIGLAELSATGTASSSTYLRGDNSWATVSGGGGSGLFTSYARVSDVKAYNVHGGAVPNDNYFTYRTLNTEDWDPDGIILGVGGKATSGNLKTNNIEIRSFVKNLFKIGYLIKAPKNYNLSNTQYIKILTNFSRKNYPMGADS